MQYTPAWYRRLALMTYSARLSKADAETLARQTGAPVAEFVEASRTGKTAPLRRALLEAR